MTKTNIFFSMEKGKTFTLVEVAISVVIFIVIMTAAFGIFGASQELYVSQSSLIVSSEAARITMNKILMELTETSLLSVDTSFRPEGVFKWSNHYKDTTPGNRHCTSTTNLYPTTPKAHTTWIYSVDAADAPSTEKHGRNWINISQNTCPLDGNFLANDCHLDAVKFFSPRTQGGDLVMEPTGFMDWQAIIFYVPFRKDNATTFELRRYVVYLSDILPVNPDEITLIDMWDFDGDGRIDDGADDTAWGYNPKVTGGITDLFEIQASTILWKKTEGTRKNEIIINRRTGETTWTIEDIYGVDESVTFTRRPKTITFGLLDIDISTNATSPFDTLANPTGVKENTVRISLVFSRPATPPSRSKMVELTSEIKPRN